MTIIEVIPHIPEVYPYRKMSNNNENEKLFKVAVKLVEAFNKTLDDNLPRQLANIVKTHAGASVVCAIILAFIPIPGITFLVGGVNIWAMYVRINNELEMSFAENIMKSISTGIVANLSSNLLFLIAVFVLSVSFGLFKIVVGPGTLAYMIVVGLALYFATISAGYIYMKVLSRLGKR